VDAVQVVSVFGCVKWSVLRPQGHQTVRRRSAFRLWRTETAAYIGISPSKLDQLVNAGWLPKPFKLDGYTALRSHGDREGEKGRIL
jgi:predicted DNA-binding transcriptional regulator AlpA